MSRVKYYGNDHITVKEIERVDHINFYPQDNIACVFHFFTDARTGKEIQTITDVPMSEIITVE